MKNVILMSLVSLVLVGCGAHYHTGYPGVPGAPGEDGKNSLIATIRFESGLALCESDKGVEVLSGLDVNDDLLLQTEEVLQMNVVCDGSNGQDGQDGTDGTDGKDGTDGQNGEDGEDAPTSAYTIVQVIDPCGKQAAFDEVLFVMYDGSILAHYSHGNKQFLTLIGNGNYVTTDGTSCNFNVNNGIVSW